MLYYKGEIETPAGEAKMKNSKQIETLKKQIKSARNRSRDGMTTEERKSEKVQIREMQKLIVELEWGQISFDDYVRLDLWIAERA